MNVKQFFSKSKPIWDKLIKFGFKEKDDKFYYEASFLNDKFKLKICIDKKEFITIKVIDLAINDEYLALNVASQQGEFVNLVRLECQKILEKIRDNCFEIFYFKSEQTNRIVEKIKELFQDKPEFLWEDTPNAGVFREPIKHKWYGIIMEIDKSKLDNKNRGLVDVLNVKLEPEGILELLKSEGFYKAYHMNKKYWISIVLDETVSDEKIISLIKKSHSLVVRK